jgi:BlaI family transcriptional regulator, penicillinase repressor
MPETHQLTDLQIAIMRILWERGQATVAEIHEAMRPERGLAQTTVATLLSRLAKRGVVRHQTRNRQYIYEAAVSESEVRRSMIDEMTERLFDGDVAALMSHLLAARDISADDLTRVKELIAAHEANAEDGNAES